MKLSNHLKTVHSEQLTKLHLKHQQDTELLDDIRYVVLTRDLTPHGKNSLIMGKGKIQDSVLEQEFHQDPSANREGLWYRNGEIGNNVPRQEASAWYRLQN